MSPGREIHVAYETFCFVCACESMCEWVLWCLPNHSLPCLWRQGLSLQAELTGWSGRAVRESQNSLVSASPALILLVSSKFRLSYSMPSSHAKLSQTVEDKSAESSYLVSTVSGVNFGMNSSFLEGFWPWRNHCGKQWLFSVVYRAVFPEGTSQPVHDSGPKMVLAHLEHPALLGTAHSTQ